MFPDPWKVFSDTWNTFRDPLNVFPDPWNKEIAFQGSLKHEICVQTFQLTFKCFRNRGVRFMNHNFDLLLFKIPLSEERKELAKSDYYFE